MGVNCYSVSIRPYRSRCQISFIGIVLLNLRCSRLTEAFGIGQVHVEVTCRRILSIGVVGF
jgi:hypothetical protein